MSCPYKSWGRKRAQVVVYLDVEHGMHIGCTGIKSWPRCDARQIHHILLKQVCETVDKEFSEH